MKKHRVVQMGLGGFGSLWMERTLVPCDRVEVVGVVTGNPAKHRWITETAGIGQERIYSDLAAALDEQKPDLFLNVTPPHVHLATVMEAVNRGIPVLCEKPIAHRDEDAQLLLAAAEAGAFIAIGENYRFMETVVRARNLLGQGIIGPIDSIDLHFARRHDLLTGYHVEMDHPMLLDVSIHHLDLLRFLTGREPRQVFARAWCPPWSHYRHNANLNMDILLDGGVHVSYHGGLAFHGHRTDWLGHWRIEGRDGLLEFKTGTIAVQKDGGRTVEKVPDRDDSQRRLLDDVLDALEQGTKPATHIGDNIHTYRFTLAAIKSADTGFSVRLV